MEFIKNFRYGVVAVCLLMFASAAAQRAAKTNSVVDKIPNPKELMWKEGAEIDNMLNELGYSGDYKYSSDDTYIEYGQYTLQQNGKAVVISFKYEEDGGYGFELKVTISGDDAALNKFYNKALKLKEKGSSWQTDVQRNKDTVIIISGGD